MSWQSYGTPGYFKKDHGMTMSKKNTLLLFGNMAWFLMDIKKYPIVKKHFLN